MKNLLDGVIMPILAFVESVKNWYQVDEGVCDVTDISKKEANLRGTWDVIGKLMKKMGFLVTTASFVTWFVEPAYLPEVMASLYLATILIICYENRKKSETQRPTPTDQNSHSMTQSFFCMLSGINPYIKGVFMSIVSFNIATYWVFRLGHVFNTPLLNFPVRLLPYMLAISVVSLVVGIAKCWQSKADQFIKDCVSFHENVESLPKLNAICASSARAKAYIRGSSEWLLVMHNTFFLLLSCFSLGFFTLGRLSKYTIGTLTAASGLVSTKVSLTTNKFSSAYLMRKLASNSDYLMYDGENRCLTLQTLDVDNKHDAHKPC